MQQTKFQWMLIHPAHIIAQGAGSGLIHPASGTWGTLVGWVLFVFFNQSLIQYPWAWWLVLLVTFPIGVWACSVTGRDLNSPDDSSIVIDEIWAIWLVLAMLSPMHFSLLEQSAAFVLFRLFDIWKPYPIRLIDSNWKGGLGVMMDDVLAALYTLLVFALGVQLFRWFSA